MKLFEDNNEKIRTLGFYQPFGTLMLHGKVETRWVTVGKKPPFPLGNYLFYTTKKECDNMMLSRWANLEIQESIVKVIGNNKPKNNGYAIGMGKLIEVRFLKPTDLSFVDFHGEKVFFDTKGNKVIKRQWALIFINVKPIDQFKWEYGKQWVGFVPQCEIEKIKQL